MTPTETPATKKLSERRSYRRLLGGIVVVAVLSNLVLRYLDYRVAAELVYLLGAVGFVAVGYGTSVSLFDERDVAIEQRTSQLTVSVSAVVLILGASTARLLSATGFYDVPTIVWGALYGYVAVFVTFVASFLWVRSRR
ncbi:DUF2178 domain-containing protein [Halobium palmae]|uniref:DUF2178 domain-containing protein n=1 Tax=Halobium palmae TaxID=1776492 RepID=A0ABD5RZW0_9EURY